MKVDVDVDQFRVLKPWRDASFWITVAWSSILLGALLFPDAAAWVHRNQNALAAVAAPLVAWLGMHGVIRWEGVRQLGNATVAALAANVDEPAGVTKAVKS
jgi:hypothetical protein